MGTDDDRTLESAFACYREAQRPSSGEVSDTWAALQRRIAEGDTGPSVPAPAEEPSRRSAALVGFVAAAACVGVFVVLPTARVIAEGASAAGPVESEFDATNAGDSGAATARLTAPEAAAPRRRPIAPSAADPTTAPIETIEPGPAAPELPAATHLPSALPSRHRGPPANAHEATSVAASPSEMSAQASALQRAQASLSGDPREALAQVRAHREDYPDSPFARERDALGLLAACASGQRAQVSAQVDAFVQRQSDSPLSRRVQRACRKVP